VNYGFGLKIVIFAHHWVRPPKLPQTGHKMRISNIRIPQGKYIVAVSNLNPSEII
jgi:hypothetical protein